MNFVLQFHVQVGATNTILTEDGAQNDYGGDGGGGGGDFDGGGDF